VSLEVSPPPVGRRWARAFAPASIGNVAVGFDLLGQTVAGPGDRATVWRTEGGVVIGAIRGVVTALPRDPDANTAGRALLALAARYPGVGFYVELDKGIALGSGMGGSAASAVAALVAANALLDTPLGLEDLYALAVEGESAASGGYHGDNVGPMLYGGLVLAPSSGCPVRVPIPPGLTCALVHPHFILETRHARAALAGHYTLAEHVAQSEGLALVLAGCYSNDLSLIRRGLRDVIVEPRRAGLIPGFARVKQAALDHGALGASISGAGPSVFGWFADATQAQAAGAAMAAAFAEVGMGSDVLVSPAGGPAAAVEAQG
jgi:homoserine kinase